MSVLQIEFIPDPELGADAFDALVLTSVNALRRRHCDRWPGHGEAMGVMWTRKRGWLLGGHG